MDILTTEGFIKTYFDLLPYCCSLLEAFDIVNNTVYAITGEYPYKSIDAFRDFLYSDSDW